MSACIEVKSIHKQFPLNRIQQKKTGLKVKTAVDGISFSVEKGEIYGLLGNNGAGKTTTLRMISTLLTPDQGEIYMDGINIRTNPELARRRIGFLTTELKLDDYFSPNDLFDFFSDLHGIDRQTAARRKQLLFDKIGITDFADQKIGRLSTGMKQKVSIVIALAHDPEIIIFDEPTNGLDVVTSRNVMDFILELKKEGKTILVSSHIFSVISKLCDRVGFVMDGHMVLNRSMDEIPGEQALEELFFSVYDAYYTAK